MDQLEAAIGVVQAALPPGSHLGTLLYGSAVDGGLRPDSDVDLLVVTDRRLSDKVTRRLIDGFLPISGRATRPPSWRPLEVTVVAQPEIRPWRYPPRLELQYGEWLRDAFLAGEAQPWRDPSPDLAVLLTMARARGRPLVGPMPPKLIDPIPRDDLDRAMRDELPSLLEDLEDDTRNVLLTLARMWSSRATGAILTKDAAADWAIERLPSDLRDVLVRARDLYRAGGYGTWDDVRDAVRGHVAYVADRITGPTER